MVKLDAMENPYVWPDELRMLWLQRMQRIDVNRYPDPEADALKQRLRQSLQLGADAPMLLGNGSDEIIQLILMALAGSDRVVLSVEPGFAMYRMISTFTGMRYVGVPLRPEDFTLDMPALLEAIDRERPAVVFLACPNNPTGNQFSAGDVERLLRAVPGLVVVDEAYAPFTDQSFLDAVPQHSNLLVMRTLSKMGLAGLRLGLLVGPGDWLSEINKVRLPYNINVLTQVSVDFALEHQNVFDAQTQAIRRDRGRLVDGLRQVPGVKPYPSEANFVLFRVPPGQAGLVHQQLAERGVLIKKLDGAHPLLDDCLRVTVGSPDENARFLQALAESIVTPR
jgi:histidinol-phosphate aminotransferase